MSKVSSLVGSILGVNIGTIVGVELTKIIFPDYIINYGAVLLSSLSVTTGLSLLAMRQLKEEVKKD